MRLKLPLRATTAPVLIPKPSDRRIVPFPATEERHVCGGLGFSDPLYLDRVILHLKKLRMRKGLSRKSTARLGNLDPRVIERAEQEGVIPPVKAFKAWAAALGLPWEDLWSQCLP